MNAAQLNAMIFFPGKALVSIDGTVGLFAGIRRLDDSGKNFEVSLEVGIANADYDVSRRQDLTEIRKFSVTTD
jgi:hypothetical protein